MMITEIEIVKRLQKEHPEYAGRIGFKFVNADLTARGGFQYRIGQMAVATGDLAKIGTPGVLHYCESIKAAAGTRAAQGAGKVLLAVGIPSGVEIACEGDYRGARCLMPLEKLDMHSGDFVKFTAEPDGLGKVAAGLHRRLGLFRGADEIELSSVAADGLLVRYSGRIISWDGIAVYRCDLTDKAVNCTHETGSPFLHTDGNRYAAVEATDGEHCYGCDLKGPYCLPCTAKERPDGKSVVYRRQDPQEGGCADMAAEIGRLLTQRGLKMVTAETVTGGAIAARLTAVTGSSEWFAGGCIYAADEQRLPGVQAATLKDHGAVSVAAVYELMEGLEAHYGAQAGIVVSGVAVPGGLLYAPAGSIICGAFDRGAYRWRTCRFDGDCASVRRQAEDCCLKLLLGLLDGSAR